MDVQRCPWGSNPLLIEYHDKEWGVPLHDEMKLFEALILDGFQSGLSWQIILNKRENFRKAFGNFDFNRISKYSSRDIKRLLANAGIIRNRLKIEAAISNAKKFLEVRKEFGSFDKYIWGFVGERPLKNNFRKLSELPPTSREADKMSKDLKKRGFKFVGPTVCYAFMQGVGMVNDHLTNCFRHDQLDKSKS